jgi:GNAT superfamily N-acetyltransferase/uncharacterized damage-inducible protein DinB
MSDGVHIRRAEPADAPRLAALSGELGYPVAGDALAGRLARMLTRPEHVVLVAEVNGGVAGWLHATETELLESGCRCEIAGLVVDATCRRQGVGGRLVAAVERWAADRGLELVAVRSNVARQESHPFYERHGYTRAKTQHAYRKRLSTPGQPVASAAPRPPTGRPEPGEYASYARADIALVPGDDAVRALGDLAAETTAAFAAVPESMAHRLTYAPGKWTLKEVLGHLAEDERIFAHRILCLARGEPRPLPGFDENLYVAGAAFEQRRLANLLEEYWVVRRATLALLEGLPPEAWRRRGIVNDYEATVRGLAWHIAGHERHHLDVLRARYLPGVTPATA